MQKPASISGRIASIDMMQGLVIILMTLDHVRERFSMHVQTGDPIFDTGEPDLFFTRLITHLCAPIFIALAGVSAWLFAHPGPGQYRPLYTDHVPRRESIRGLQTQRKTSQAMAQRLLTASTDPLLRRLNP
jgi:uncharacterized membrane protein